VWSGTTLRRTSVQLSKPSDATYSARPVGQPGCGRRLPQPGVTTDDRRRAAGLSQQQHVWCLEAQTNQNFTNARERLLLANALSVGQRYLPTFFRC